MVSATAEKTSRSACAARAPSSLLRAVLRVRESLPISSANPPAPTCDRKLKSAVCSRCSSACQLKLAGTTWSRTLWPYSLASSSRFRLETCPFSIALNSSAGDIFMALAILSRAPGRASPSCWVSSSALTLPLDIICSKALKTRFCSSSPSLNTRETSLNLLKMKNVSSAVAPPARAAMAKRP